MLITESERFEFTGLHGSQAWCELAIYRADNGYTTVIVTEPIDERGGYANPGTSVTNAAEGLANRLVKEMGLDLSRLAWVEHYPERGGRGPNHLPESYSLVIFNIVRGKLARPRWEHRDKSVIEDLIGEKLP